MFEDETDLRLFPNLRAGWFRRGEPGRISISGVNAKRVVFGAMNVRSGHSIFAAEKRQRQFEFQSFLRLVRATYRGWHVMMLLDEDSSHTAIASKALAEEIGVELAWLPCRCSELNPMETLWGQAKDRVSANWQYESIEEHVDIFLNYLNSLGDEEILRTSGVLSGNFWLDL